MYEQINAASSYKERLSENIADAMGIFMVAKADGKETAIDEAEYWYKIRGSSSSPDSSIENTHDSRETLQLVIDKIKNSPAFESDDKAFAAAVELGFKGTNISVLKNTFEVENFESKEFQDNIKSTLLGLQKSYVDFREGSFGPRSFLMNLDRVGNLSRIIGDKLSPHPKISQEDKNGNELGKRLAEEFDSTVEAAKKIIPENRRIAEVEKKRADDEFAKMTQDYLNLAPKTKTMDIGHKNHVKKPSPSSGFMKMLMSDDANSHKKTNKISNP